MKELDAVKVATMFNGVTILKERLLPSKTIMVSADIYEQLMSDDLLKKKPAGGAYDVNVLCTVNRKGDIEINPYVRAFVGQRCVITGRRKSGLIEVGLEDDINFRVAVPQSNIDLL